MAPIEGVDQVAFSSLSCVVGRLSPYAVFAGLVYVVKPSFVQILSSSTSHSAPPCTRRRSVVRLVVMDDWGVKPSAEDLSDV